MDSTNSSKNKSKNKKKAADDNFIDKIIELVTGKDREERKKRKKLKQIARLVQQHKNKFYNHKLDGMLPEFAHFSYEVFRKSQTMARFFDVKNHSNSIKQFLFESIISKEQNKIKEQLENESIKNILNEAGDLKSGIARVKSILQKFIGSFDSKSVNYLNSTYNQIVNLSYLITFDWFYVVHKFDSNITEDNFDYKPNFEPLDARYLTEELVAINDYLYSINLDVDFSKTMSYIKMISGDEGLADIFKKLIGYFKKLKKDDYLTNLLRLINKDPAFKPNNYSSQEKIVQDYLFTFQSQVKKCVDDHVKRVKKDQVNKVLLEIFNTSIIVRLKHYSQKINDMLYHKGMSSGLKYVEPLNYIKAFLLDICKGEVKPRIDLLIIKGTWASHSHSAEFSQILEKVNKQAEILLVFDNKCSESEKFGRELRRVAGLVKHDPKARLVMKKLLNDIDNEGKKIIVETIKLLIEFGNKIKLLIEDYNSKNPSIVIDFHKIKWEFPGDFNNDMVKIYKKISGIVNLLKTSVNSGTTVKSATSANNDNNNDSEDSSEDN